MAAFVDTNILIYAFANHSSGAVDKVAIARRLLASLLQQGELMLSAQVISEFVAVGMRKGDPPLPLTKISERIQEMSGATVIANDASLVQRALHRILQSRISYWDALIVEAALRANATTLYTEDMHHGTRYGDLELRNPFLA